MVEKRLMGVSINRKYILFCMICHLEYGGEIPQHEEHRGG